MFPSLVGFGWGKVWHGDMVAYAMEVPPQDKLEQVIYDEFHQCLSEQTGQAEFIRRLEPLLHDIGYNICTRYKVRQKRYIPGGKFISSRRLKIIYNTNRNIYQCLYDWIGFCANPDFKMAALRFSSSDQYFSDAVFPLVHPFWVFMPRPINGTTLTAYIFIRNCRKIIVTLFCRRLNMWNGLIKNRGNY